MSNLPSPVEGLPLIGQERAETTLRTAIDSGRLHHGWIIAGPGGIGKATLAYRAARFLLSGGGNLAATLDIDPNDPVCRKVSAHAHPGLLALEPPPPEPGKQAGLIKVEEVRKLGHFLGRTSGEGGWRVVIIDSADSLNAQGQNAILKLLEEPPKECLFLIISHQPGRLLPTIRSRCRMLELEPLSETQMREILHNAGYEDDEDLALALRFAGGDVERAAQIAAGDDAKALAALAETIDTLPEVSPLKVTELAGLAGARGKDVLFRIVIDAMTGWLRGCARQMSTSASPSALAPYAELWTKIGARAGQTLGYNLDRSHCIATSLYDIEAKLAPRTHRK